MEQYIQKVRGKKRRAGVAVSDNVFGVRFGRRNNADVICDGWSAPLQTINSCLKQMEKEGVITLYVDSDNRRKKRVRLTPEGEKIAAELVEPIMQAENASFSALTPAEQAQLLELTKRQLTVLKKLVDES